MILVKCFVCVNLNTIIFRNFKLLSFGEEAEEDEEELIDAVKEFSGRPKSTHDILKDPQLSSEPAVIDNFLKEDIQISTSDQTSKYKY